MRTRAAILTLRAATLCLGLTPASVLAQTPPATGTLPPAPEPATTQPAPPSLPPEAAPSPEPVPAPRPPQISPPAPPPPASWRARYVAARERLVAGDFARAASAFDELARSAPGDFERAQCIELASLAREWDRRGYVFVRKQDFGESAVRARAVDERTTDEIAVLYLNAVLYGIGTGGWLAVQTEANTAAGVILPSLGLAGASAGLIALLDSGRPLRYGVPQSIVSGMYVGLFEGLVWTFWNHARADRADEWEGSTVATVIWGSATAGAVAGGVIGSTAGSTPGRASFAGSAALWGGLTAGLSVAALHDDDYAQDDAALLGAAIGLNAGVVGGVLAAGPVSPSIARVRFLDLGALAGGLTFGGLYLSAAGDDSDERTAAGAAALGIGVGLGTAWFLTDDMEPDRGAERAAAASAVRPTLVASRGAMGLGLAGYW